VFGRPGLREAQSAGQLIDAALASPKEMQDATRCGSAIALNASEVVAARAMPRTYAYMGMFVNRIA
jgi:hypothetical protein